MNKKLIALLAALGLLLVGGVGVLVVTGGDEPTLGGEEMTPATALDDSSVSFSVPGGFETRSLTQDRRGQERVPGELLVRYEAGAAPGEIAEVRSELEFDSIEKLPLEDVELVNLEEGESVKDTIDALESDPAVEYAEPNFIYSAFAVPNDALFTELWGLDNAGQSIAGVTGTSDVDIDAPEAWDVTTGSKDVVVAVVDTGVSYNHPDLAPNMWTNPGEAGDLSTNGVDDDGNGLVDDWRGWDWVQNDNDPADLQGHGTHVAGTIGARGNDGFGVTGVNWEVSLMALRALDARGQGSLEGIGKAFEDAAAQGADIVNASLGGASYSQTMLDAISNYPDTLFVVAAGNNASNNDSSPSYPCNFELPNLICVAAVDSADGLASFSNYGTKFVHVAAPGVSVLSSQPDFEPIVREDFEGETALWQGEPGTTWGLAPNEDGQHLSDSPGTGYASNTNSGAVNTTPLDLSANSGCRAQYRISLDTEQNVDNLYVEYSPDGENWIDGSHWSGSTGGQWRSMKTPVPEISGMPSAYVRFRLTSDGDTEGDGAFIDDIEVRCVVEQFGGDEFEYLRGTSMASPHVAGVAALLLAAQPDAAVAELRDAILSTVDPVAALDGRVSTGGRVNARAALDALGA